MTPTEAVQLAKKIARHYDQRIRDAVESEILYSYVLATRAWRADGGASLTRYCHRRMNGGAAEAVRTHTRRRPEHLLGYLDRDVTATSAAGRRKTRGQVVNDGVELEWAPLFAQERAGRNAAEILRSVACRTNRRCAWAAWLAWGLGYPIAVVARELDVSEARIFQMFREIKKAMAA